MDSAYKSENSYEPDIIISVKTIRPEISTIKVYRKEFWLPASVISSGSPLKKNAGYKRVTVKTYSDN